MEEMVQKATTDRRRNEAALLVAAEGDAELLRRLASDGADLRHADKHGRTALHFACTQGHLSCVRFLFERGCDADADDKEGRTPLHAAALFDRAEVVEYLCEKGAWVDPNDARDCTPLHLACRKASVTTVERLLEHGASHKAVNRMGLTPLGEALLRGRTDLATTLISHGADVHVRAKGYTLLHVTAALGQLDCSKLLMKHGIKADDTLNTEGFTALHCGVLGAHAASVTHISSAMLHMINAEDLSGRTALDLAESSSNDVVAELKRRGGKVGSKQKVDTLKTGSVSSFPYTVEKFKALSSFRRTELLEEWAKMTSGELRLRGADPTIIQEVDQVRQRALMKKVEDAIEFVRRDEDFMDRVHDPKTNKALMQIRDNIHKANDYVGNEGVLIVVKRLRTLQLQCRDIGVRVEMTQLIDEFCGPKPTTSRTDSATLRQRSEKKSLPQQVDVENERLEAERRQKEAEERELDEMFPEPPPINWRAFWKRTFYWQILPMLVVFIYFRFFSDKAELDPSSMSERMQQAAQAASKYVQKEEEGDEWDYE
eukprot:jgi/Chlat1/6070/Chrsp4S09089